MIFSPQTRRPIGSLNVSAANAAVGGMLLSLSISFLFIVFSCLRVSEGPGEWVGCGPLRSLGKANLVTALLRIDEWFGLAGDAGAGKGGRRARANRVNARSVEAGGKRRARQSPLMHNRNGQTIPIAAGLTSVTQPSLAVRSGGHLAPLHGRPGGTPALRIGLRPECQ